MTTFPLSFQPRAHFNMIIFVPGQARIIFIGRKIDKKIDKTGLNYFYFSIISHSRDRLFFLNYKNTSKFVDFPLSAINLAFDLIFAAFNLLS